MPTRIHPTLFLSFHDTRKIILAAEHALWAHVPFIRFITINLDLAGIGQPASDFVTAYLKLAGDWLATKGTHRYYATVLENPPSKSVGFNIHIAMHVPFEHLLFDFPRLELRWIKEAGGKRRDPRVLVPRTIGDADIRYPEYGFLWHYNRVVEYLLKGAHPNICRALGIKHEPQGCIYGKRAGTSESLSLSKIESVGLTLNTRYQRLTGEWRRRLPVLPITQRFLAVEPALRSHLTGLTGRGSLM
jgi:hypothetical protein